jgi:carbon-monoxide dehydrogenase iron sulfur subunit
MCIMVCPWGAIAVGEGPRRKIASKCDLCRLEFQEAPTCVANCPNEALKYEER